MVSPALAAHKYYNAYGNTNYKEEHLHVENKHTLSKNGHAIQPLYLLHSS